MTYNRNAVISFTGTIVNETFRIYASHASFELTDLSNIEKVGGEIRNEEDDILRPTRVVYWGKVNLYVSFTIFAWGRS